MDAKPEEAARRKQPIPGYEILEKIGSGGAGTIYKARQLSMDRVLALKVLKKSELKDPLPLDRLRREALLIARMDHPHIVKGIDMGETDRYYYFAMEYVEGRSLREVLELQGPLDEKEAAAIVRDVTLALQYAHEQKLTHRDIKPGNIIVKSGGGIKVADLGLAKGEHDLSITRDGATVGTPQYIAPEQARSPKAADIRSDIYSLGATYYHMITGRLPFEGDTIGEVITKVLFESPPPPESFGPVSRGTSRVISKMMAKDPRRRYLSPTELLEDIERLAGSLEGVDSEDASGSIGLSWKESQQGRWSRAIRVAAGLGLLLSACALLLLLIFGRDKDLRRSQKEEIQAAFLDLQEAYARKEADAGHTLRKLSTFPAAQEPEQAAAFRVLRNQILADSRRVLDQLFVQEVPAQDRALVQGGFEKAPSLLEQACAAEAERILGRSPEALDPGLGAYWQMKIRGAQSRLADRVEKERSLLLDEALQRWRQGKSRVEEQLEARFFAEAWASHERLVDAGSAFLEAAAAEHAEKLAARAGIEARAPNPLLDRKLEEVFVERMKTEKTAAAALGERILAEALEAGRRYQASLEARALGIAAAAGEALLGQGAGEILDQAARSPDLSNPPRLPDIVRHELPGREELLAKIDSAVANRKAELQTRAQEEASELFYQGLVERLAAGDLAGAQAHLDSFPREEGIDPSILRSWRALLTTLGRIEPRALEAFEEYLGLDVLLRTARGVRYAGILEQVDTERRRIELQIESGRKVELLLSELEVEEVLAWAGKKELLDRAQKGLYAYLKGDRDRAKSFLEQAEDLEGRTWFLSAIRMRSLLEEEKRLTEEQRLDGLLDEAENALDAGNWEKGLFLLEEASAAFRATRAWSDVRRRRESLEEALRFLKASTLEEEHLMRLFSVETQRSAEDRVRVAYTFDSPEEMQDFTGSGFHWQVREGALFCGISGKEESSDYFHNQVGIRFGAPFDPKSPLTLGFNYLAPREGQGPTFLGISVYGACLGIRSFDDPATRGQVNAWSGDLDGYGDYFFLPDLGEERPAKGKCQPFEFRRGERYRIEVAWFPGRELLLSVDGKEIYRARGLKSLFDFMEIKSFREAKIDDLVIEGILKR